jgi:ketosteroid isomerase-like protein
MERDAVTRWIAAYESAWRTLGTDALAELFTPDVTYRTKPWARPIEGIERLARFWDAEREGPDEGFEMRSEIVAIDGATAVVRVEVTYTAPPGTSWRDLWIVEFDADAPDARCSSFEEWPFASRRRP